MGTGQTEGLVMVRVAPCALAAAIGVPGADHGFRRAGDEGWEGFARVLEDVTAWFLAE